MIATSTIVIRVVVAEVIGDALAAVPRGHDIIEVVIVHIEVLGDRWVIEAEELVTAFKVSIFV